MAMRRSLTASPLSSFILCVIAFIYTTKALPQSHQARPDNIRFGLYSIQGCSTKVDTVTTALSTLHTILRPAITDSLLPHTSPSFDAFFKNVSYAPFVRRILASIAAGTPTQQKEDNLGIGVSSPVIACLQEGPYAVPNKTVLGLRPHIQRTAFQDCSDGRLEASAVWMGGTPVVVLCPRFFSYPLQLEEGRTCLAVDPRTNSFIGDGGGVHKTMVYALLHELVHVYLGALIRRQRMDKEVYAVQDCYKLSGAKARLSPSNYQFYVNSVYWGCDRFPRQQPDDGRELMESYSNYTMIPSL